MKRSYVRLSAEQWAEARALWQAGEHTLAELAERFGVSSRGLQLHFEKHGTVKGSAMRALAARVEADVLAAVLPDGDDLTARATTIREVTYAHAVTIEGMLLSRLDAARRDPTAPIPASAIKALALAAQTLQRLHDVKRAALGLDRDAVLEDELPVLMFEDLSEAEIIAIRQHQDDDGLELPMSAPAYDPDTDGIEEIGAPS